MAEATIVSRYLPWVRGSRVAEATIVSRYLRWVRGSPVAEATIVSCYYLGARGDPRGRSHYREATIIPWSAATRVAEATIGKPPSPIEFEVATWYCARKTCLE